MPGTLKAGVNAGPLYVGADNLIEYGTADKPLRRSDTGALVTDATVTFALKTLAGVTVTNGTGTCSYVSGSEGKYQGTLGANASLSDLTEYDLEITAASGTLDDFRKIRVLAMYRGER